MKAGGKIKLLRTLADISQQKLAELLGVSQRDIVFFEKDKLVLRIEHIDLLAGLFFCHSEFFIQKNLAFKSFCGFRIPHISSGYHARAERKKISMFRSILPLLEEFLTEQCVPEYEIFMPVKGSFYTRYSYYSFKTHNNAYLCFQVDEVLKNDFESIISEFKLIETKTFDFEKPDLLYPPHMYFDEGSELFMCLSTFVKHFYPFIHDLFIEDFRKYKEFQSLIKERIKKGKIQQIIDIMRENQITLEDLQRYL